MKRAVAYRMPIKALLDKEFVKGTVEQASYLKVNEKLNISRVRIWGNVVRKFTSDNMASLTIDDFSGVIDVNFFKEDTKLIDDIVEGDVIEAIGKIRQGNDGIFIAGEIVRKIKIDEEMLMRLENVKTMKQLASMESPQEIEFPSDDFKIEVEKNIIE